MRYFSGSFIIDAIDFFQRPLMNQVGVVKRSPDLSLSVLCIKNETITLYYSNVSMMTIKAINLVLKLSAQWVGGGGLTISAATDKGIANFPPRSRYRTQTWPTSMLLCLCYYHIV